MITITRYQCEICNSKFDTEVEATDCEASHLTVESISIFRVRGYRHSKPFPREIDVTDGAGANITYIRKN